MIHEQSWQLRVLHIEDNPADALLIARTLAKDELADIRLTQVDNLKAALELLQRETYDVLLTDLGLPDAEGLELIDRVRQQAPTIPITALSGSIEQARSFTLITKGAHEFVSKKEMHIGGVVVRAMRHAIERQRLNEQLEDRARALAAKLLASEARFQTLSDSSLDGILVVTMDGQVLYANPTAEQTLGGPQSQLPPEVEAALAADRPRNKCVLENLPRAVRLDLRSTEISWGKNPARLVSLRDVTREHELESQLLQSQKMEAIGQLAGGVAHDFNNLLSIILGYADMLLAEGDLAEPALSRIEQISKAGDRAAALTQQLLAFSRRQVVNPKVLDLNAVVSDLEKMLRRLIGEDIQLETRLGTGLSPAFMDPGRLEQVIVNLVVNARDAMPAGGRLTIETSSVNLDESYLDNHIGARPGRHTLLAISDNGQGMDAETRERIFEPFFTTKEVGKGTGLGLSTVYGIVNQAEGSIWVYSEPGKGTIFKIYLPGVAEAASSKEPEVAPADSRGTETILVLEDDRDVRLLVVASLLAAGYQVIETGDVDEALELFASHQEDIDLFLVDVVMPKRSGPQVAEKIMQLRPSLPVLYMSGYSDNAIVNNGLLEPGMNFLEKPIRPKQLREKIREIFQQRPPRGC